MEIKRLELFLLTCKINVLPLILYPHLNILILKKRKQLDHFFFFLKINIKSNKYFNLIQSCIFLNLKKMNYYIIYKI